MIFSSIKIRLACKIWVLYLQNQASYVNFLFVKVMRNLNFAKSCNLAILLKFLDFKLIFYIPSIKCYIATWGKKIAGIWSHSLQYLKCFFYLFDTIGKWLHLVLRYWFRVQIQRYFGKHQQKYLFGRTAKKNCICNNLFIHLESCKYE